MNSKIKSIKAREILDSRGWPTIEVILETSDFSVKASVPSGKSVGKYEAVELRDGGKRYLGRGVLKAVRNINEIIKPELIGKNVTSQKEIDNLMIKLDGTEQKSKLGANAILAVSMAVCRAGAKAKNLPLYQYISEISRGPTSAIKLPLACFNVINGGAHAGNNLDIQEFMIIPQMESFSKSLQAAAEIYHNLKEILRKRIGKLATNLGDEGGFSPPLARSQQALDLIIETIKKAGFKNKVKVGLDCASSQFFKNNNYHFEKAVFTREGLLTFYQDLIKNYPILFLEDPFSEEDWQGWKELMSKIPPQRGEARSKKLSGKIQNSKLIIIGDDLLATNPKRIREAEEKKACNGLVLKPNQIGTITEALNAAKLAKRFSWKIMVSHRSGETSDTFISDLAVGIGADFIKSGAPVRGERVAKYNRLLEIEGEIQ